MQPLDSLRGTEGAPACARLAGATEGVHSRQAQARALLLLQQHARLCLLCVVRVETCSSQLCMLILAMLQSQDVRAVNSQQSAVENKGPCRPVAVAHGCVRWRGAGTRDEQRLKECKRRTTHQPRKTGAAQLPGSWPLGAAEAARRLSHCAYLAAATQLPWGGEGAPAIMRVQHYPRCLPYNTRHCNCTLRKKKDTRRLQAAQVGHRSPERKARTATGSVVRSSQIHGNAVPSARPLCAPRKAMVCSPSCSAPWWARSHGPQPWHCAVATLSVAATEKVSPTQ
jgi:hypothetical protein